jgi:arginine-tRNA-protein transferase
MVEHPRECSYLPEQMASLDYRVVADLSAAEYADLLESGYRRFGRYVFKPACRTCRECRSLRIPVRDFHQTASHRRVIRANGNIRAELRPVFATLEHLQVFNAYHDFMADFRQWKHKTTTAREYIEDFVAHPFDDESEDCALQWLYFEEDRLLGVSLMDEVRVPGRPAAISLVYCFYDPAWRPRSPGTFAILNQLAYARETGAEYAYLGYWVEGCQSLAYKSRYKPAEVLPWPVDAGCTAQWTPAE